VTKEESTSTVEPLLLVTHLDVQVQNLLLLLLPACKEKVLNTASSLCVLVVEWELLHYSNFANKKVLSFLKSNIKGVAGNGSSFFLLIANKKYLSALNIFKYYPHTFHTERINIVRFEINKV